MSTFSYRPPEGRKIFGLHFRRIFKILLIIASFFLSFLRLTGREPFYYRIIGFCVLGPSSLTIFSVKLGVESLFQPISWEGFSPMSFPFSPVPKGTVFLPAQHTSSLEELLSNVPVHRGRFHSQSCRPWPLCPMASSALNLPLDVALIYPPLFLDDREW